MQALPRLEPQFTDRSRTFGRGALRTESLAALGAPPSKQPPAALRGHAGAEAVGAGAMQITRIECTFHSTGVGKAFGQENRFEAFSKGGKGTERAGMCQ
jgi:hypothetical protein